MFRSKWVKIVAIVLVGVWFFNNPASAGATVQKAWGLVGTAADRTGTFFNAVTR